MRKFRSFDKHSPFAFVVAICLILSLGVIFVIQAPNVKETKAAVAAMPETSLADEVLALQPVNMEQLGSQIEAVKTEVQMGRVVNVMYRKSNGKFLTYAEFVELLVRDVGFCRFHNDVLAAAPFEAFFWETRPITKATAALRSFSYVIVNAPSLATKSPDIHSFAAAFDGDDEFVTTIPNLGGDALLVIPRKLDASYKYTHIAAFTRHAPKEQQIKFWSSVGHATSERLEYMGSKTTWLSTSGLGIYWLHVRLDTVPKYYTWEPYRSTQP